MTEPDSEKWPEEILQVLIDYRVRQVAYVPDIGHARLISMCLANNEIKAIALTTEEEGVALLAGAWLGGQRGALLMQSSGVGNCINMLVVAGLGASAWDVTAAGDNQFNLPLVLPPKDGAYLKDRFRRALLGAHGIF